MQIELESSLDCCTQAAHVNPEHAAAFGSLGLRSNAPELWAEVSIAHQGPPRPIRLGIKKDDQNHPVPVN